MSYRAALGASARICIVTMLTLMTLLLPSVPAAAQSGPAPPPVFQTVDERGVELASKRLMLQISAISIGPDGPGGLSFSWGVDSTMEHNYLQSGGFTTQGAQFSVVFGRSRETFTFTGSAASAVFSQDQGRGATLSYSLSTNSFTYVSAEGMTAVFDTPSGNTYVLRSKTYPTGERETYYYGADFRTVTSSLGYQLRLGLTNVSGSMVVTSAVVFNMADETCDPAAATCSLTGSWPSISRNYTTGLNTDSLGRQTQVTWSTGGYTITYPTGRTVSYTGQYGQPPGGGPLYFKVYSYSDGAGTWTYQNPAPVYAPPVALVFGPGNPAPEQYVFNNAGRMTYYNDYRVSSGGLPYQQVSYDAKNRVTSWTVGGSTTQYTYDARGNVTSSRQISTTPGTPADIIRTAEFPASCSNPKICNKPVWTRDAKGNQTDYTYIAATGQVETVTGPAPAAGGARPKVTYTYGNFQAYYRNPSGAIVASGLPVSLLTAGSSCVAGTTCVGTASEARWTADYGPQNGTANNLRAVSTTDLIGDGSVISTTSYTYNGTGDVLTVDGPLAADMTRYFYDTMRQPVGTIGSDPDGAGAAAFPAIRTTYNGEGQPTKQESGTATSQALTGMTTFTAHSETNTTYNAQGRVATQSVAAGGTTYALTQYSYAINGLPTCAAERMNPATYGSLPASACTLASSGSFGADRITQTNYDLSLRPTSIVTALGTADQAVEQTRTYDALGRLSSLTDAENNTTTYVYDGMNRLQQTRFPSSAKGSGTSSTTDYEQIAYDPNGNATSFRTRAGETLYMTYDNLDRITLKDVPYRASMPTHTRDVYYGYDLAGNMLFARFDNVSGEGITNVFNALGQLASVTTNMDGVSRTLSYGYSLAGNRTFIQHPDGNFIRYYYYDGSQDSGAFYVSYLNASSPLFYQPLDSLGRSSVLYRYRPGVGWDQYSQFGYDAISRLASVFQNPNNVSHDTTTTLAYNPASQITSRTNSNDAYAFPGYANLTRGYISNGLNQYGSVNGTTFGYDANGNLTSDGSYTFAYDAENRLVSRTGGATASLRYDPLGRLYELAGASGARRYLYDGDDLVLEYASDGTIAERYVHGLGAGDNPLVWFSGYSVGDAARRYLYADERGSIVGVTDSNGNVLGVNSYDEHGIPASGNLGRFQYTGQAWIPELGMYYYKARMYSPTLGRFMQTDPVGYGDGMNMYAYVGNDPANAVDPSGRCTMSLSGGLTWTPWLGTHYGATQLIDPPMISFLGCDGAGYDASPRGGFFGGDPSFNRPTPPPDACDDRLTHDPVRNPRLAVPTPGTLQGASDYMARRTRNHYGIDIANPAGAPVFAAGDGTVVRSDYRNATGFGGQVVIDHGGGIFTQYGHMTSLIAEGTRVRGGQRIGNTATPGQDSPGAGNLNDRRMSPHVHFEVRTGSQLAPSQGGKTIDPKLCLPGSY